MNQAQRNYFIKRLNDIKAEKMSELKKEYEVKYNAVPSTMERAKNFMRKHKKQVAEQLYSLALLQMTSPGNWSPRIQLSEGMNENVPPFLVSLTKAYQAETDALKAEQEERQTKLSKKASELMDKFYFSEMPDTCEKLLNELKEFSI